MIDILRTQMPILLLILPLFGAIFCLLVPLRRVAAGLAILCGFACFLMSGVLLAEVTLSESAIAYQLGGWTAPYGIELVIDALNAPVLLLVALIGALVMPYAAKSITAEIAPRQHPLFFALLLLTLTGLLGVTATGDAFNLFVFLEISSLSAYPLVALGARSDRRALTAAFTYLVMGTVGATFYLIGLGLLYLNTGTLNMGDLALRLTPLMELRSVQAGCAFIIVGLGLKLALFPLHFWLPNAYTYAPSAVSTFMAACATKVAFYAFLRFLFVIFGASEIFEELRLHSLLMPLAMLAILAASTVAVMQANLKRMLAYSSVAQIGYILLGVSLGSASGLTAGFLHILNHGLMKGTLFMALGCVVYRQGHARLESLYGMGRQMPFTMAAFVIGGLSLIGVPLTAGFISKWYLLTAALSADAWPGVIALVLGSLLAIAYIWRAVEAAYFTAPPPQQNDTQNGAQTAHTPLLLLVPLWILVLANIYFGVDARGPVMLAERAAQHVLGR